MDLSVVTEMEIDGILTRNSFEVELEHYQSDGVTPKILPQGIWRMSYTRDEKGDDLAQVGFVGVTGHIMRISLPSNHTLQAGSYYYGIKVEINVAQSIPFYMGIAKVRNFPTA